ncbi:VOC family protein [Oxalobacteraceae bacterium A2-2]
MFNPNYTLLYVDNPIASASFYAELLGREPLQAQPTFALFALDSGLMLGLWSRHTVEPRALASGGGAEIGFKVADRSAVNDLYADWSARGLAIAQRPTEMDFGYTFVALDRDGHRLRVFVVED